MAILVLTVSGSVLAAGWLAVSGDSALPGADSRESSTTGQTRPPSPTQGTATSSQPPARVPTGTWAGDALLLTVTRSGATAEFECASGAATEPLVLVDGSFDVAGWYATDSGGPVLPPSQRPARRSARFVGQVTGDRMDLEVVVPKAGTTHGPYRLELGGPDLLERCL
ncbi:MAG: hypothetical protein ACRDOM_10335 [Nocardioides sp.]